MPREILWVRTSGRIMEFFTPAATIKNRSTIFRNVEIAGMRVEEVDCRTGTRCPR
jgi:hypothetical protein